MGRPTLGNENHAHSFLLNKNGIAILTFDPTYMKFDALDFGGKRGITGYRKSSKTSARRGAS